METRDKLSQHGEILNNILHLLQQAKQLIQRKTNSTKQNDDLHEFHFC